MRIRHLIAVATAAALLATACGDDGSGGGDSTSADPPEEPAGDTVTVELAEYPVFDNDVLVEDQMALDRLATDYVAGLDGDEPEMERFLFGALPVEVFDRIFADETPDDGSLAWLLYLSGYFGGRWLRGEIAAAQPDAPLVGFSQPPTEESFSASMDRAAEALAARDAGGQEVLDYARSSLFDTPPPADDPEADPIRGLTDGFGYNQGYMLEILESPPEGLATPEEYVITCSEELFSCDYATQKLAALPDITARADALDGDEAWEELVAELLPIQEAAIPRGRMVWSSGLSVQGFDQASYDQLLDVSSSFLEVIQAAATDAAVATATADEDLAATSALANAAIIVWLDAYTAGLINGEGEIELPTFG
ncbi:MAG: hypothetical protein AAGK32_08810 [Actinomycetota bacterium]